MEMIDKLIHRWQNVHPQFYGEKDYWVAMITTLYAMSLN